MKVDGMRTRFSVYDRHREYDEKIKLTGADDNSTFCTGVQKLAVDNQGFITKSGLAGSWGTNTPVKNMADIPDSIGLGVWVPGTNFKSVKEEDIKYLMCKKQDKKRIMRYSFNSGGMRGSTSTHSADTWLESLKSWENTEEQSCNRKNQVI